MNYGTDNGNFTGHNGNPSGIRKYQIKERIAALTTQLEELK